MKPHRERLPGYQKRNGRLAQGRGSTIFKLHHFAWYADLHRADTLSEPHPGMFYLKKIQLNFALWNSTSQANAPLPAAIVQMILVHVSLTEKSSAAFFEVWAHAGWIRKIAGQSTSR